MKSANSKYKVKLFILIHTALFLLWSNEFLFAETGQNKFEPVYATCLANKVNIRAGLGLNFEILGQLNRLDEVVVVERNSDWYKIKLPKQSTCFVHKDYISGAEVKADKLRVRAGAGDNFNVLGLLHKGEKVNILGTEGNWLKITAPEDFCGWVKKDYLQLSQKKFIPSPQPRPEVNWPELESAFPPQKQENKLEISGIIDDLGKIINRQGTHKLIRDKKTIYYLNSENIDLNLYLYEKVLVIGELLKTEDSPYPVIKVEQIKIDQ